MTAVDALAEHSAGRLLVTEDGELVGLVTRTDRDDAVDHRVQRALPGGAD